MLSKEFFLVSITTALSSIVYLLVSRFLDNYLFPVISNAIGLLIDISLDFISQSFIFLNKLSIKNNENIKKYIISNCISTFISQSLFILYIRYFNFKTISYTFIRLLIGCSVFIFVAFPLNKFYVFTN